MDSVATDELTDAELFAEVERMRLGMVDGSVPIFFDAETAKQYRRERFGV